MLYRTALTEAFARDNVEMLLAIPDWIDHIGDLGDTTFMVLMEFNAARCLNVVFEHCGPEIADVNTGWTHDSDKGKQQSNIVNASIQQGNVAFVLVFLKHAKKRNINMTKSCTLPFVFYAPILTAVHHGHVDIVRLMIRHRPALDLNQTCSGGRVRGSTVLMVAIEKESTEIVKILLEEEDRVDLHAVDDDGNSALHWAVKMENTEIIKMLMNAGIKEMMRNKNGQTAEEMASTQQIRQAISDFVTVESPVTVVSALFDDDVEQLTALPDWVDEVKQLLKKHGVYDSLVQKKLYKCLDPIIEKIGDDSTLVWKWRNNFGWSSGKYFLSKAVEQGNADLVKIFLKHHQRRNIHFLRTKTTPIDFIPPLEQAIMSNHIEIVRAIVLHQPAFDIDIPSRVPDHRGMTPLLLAVDRNHTSIVQLLVDQVGRVNVNAADERGRTGLYIASSRARFDIINVLMKAGADRRIKSLITGYKAIDVAPNHFIRDLIKNPTQATPSTYIFTDADETLISILKSNDYKKLCDVPNWSDRVSLLFNEPHYAHALYDLVEGDCVECVYIILEHCHDIRVNGEDTIHADDLITPYKWAKIMKHERIVQVFEHHAKKRPDIKLVNKFEEDQAQIGLKLKKMFDSMHLVIEE